VAELGDRNSDRATVEPAQTRVIAHIGSGFQAIFIFRRDDPQWRH
jgi:hypothetical protein